MKKIKRSVAAVCTAAALTLGMASCGSSSDSSSGKSSNGEKRTVYVMTIIENGAFLDMKDGFIQ